MRCLGRCLRLGASAGLVAGAIAGAVPAEAGQPLPSVEGGIVRTAIPTTGCGQPAPVASGAPVDQTIETGGEQRSYVLQLPSGYRSYRSYALVVVFHGRSKTGQSQAATTDMTDPHTIAVYPQGLPGTKDEPVWPGTPYSTPAQDGDELFVSDLLNHLQATLCVDPRSIMLAGKSDGGGFATQLACTWSRRIAAVAAIAGGFYNQYGCSPSQAVSVLEFHGTGDTIVPYDGVAARNLPSIPDWTAQWARQDDCRVGPHEFFDRADVIGLKYVGCSRGANVTHYVIAGGGHVWPGSTTAGATQTISATDIMVRFLRQHPLRVGKGQLS